MQLNRRLVAVEKSLGRSPEPDITYFSVVTGEGPDDIDRKAIVTWGRDNWCMLEAEHAEDETAFRARVETEIRKPGAERAHIRSFGDTAGAAS